MMSKSVYLLQIGQTCFCTFIVHFGVQCGFLKRLVDICLSVRKCTEFQIIIIIIIHSIFLQWKVELNELECLELVEDSH